MVGRLPGSVAADSDEAEVSADIRLRRRAESPSLAARPQAEPLAQAIDRIQQDLTPDARRTSQAVRKTDRGAQSSVVSSRSLRLICQPKFVSS